MRTTVWLLACFFLVGTACGLFAKEKPAPPYVTYGPFPLQGIRTHIRAGVGTPSAKAETDFPSPGDFPPFVSIGLEDSRPYLSRGHFVAARNFLRVFEITGVRRSRYQSIQPSIEQLRVLLKERPASVPWGRKSGGGFDANVQLPDYPPRNAGHLIQLRIGYLDAPWGSGIFYITSFSQALGNRPSNETLVYLFQGLSKDGRYYLSADFRITHPLLDRDPNERGYSSKATEDAIEKAQRILPGQPDGAFTPSLRKLREWVSTIRIE
jgi:hypothetical protein